MVEIIVSLCFVVVSVVVLLSVVILCFLIFEWCFEYVVVGWYGVDVLVGIECRCVCDYLVYLIL